MSVSGKERKGKNCVNGVAAHFTTEWKHLLLSNIYKLEQNGFFYLSHRQIRVMRAKS